MPEESALFQTYKRWPLTFERAEGTTIEDADHNKYLDFMSGIGVVNVGHNHPTVKAAIEEQLEKGWHGSNFFHYPLQEKVAGQLTDQAINGGKVFFCNSGAEANEAAIKLARKATGRTKIVSCVNSFHGRTYAGMAATGQESIQQGFGPMLTGFAYTPFNDAAALEEEVDEETAAIMLEVIQGEGGIRVGSTSFLEKAQTLAKQYDAMLVIDEVQTGIGRTGKPFAYQHEGLDPDIVTVAKGLGNGFPVGAVIGKQKLKDAFSAGSHGSTFGGNPLAMAAASATLDVAFEPDFLQEVTTKGEEFIQLLTDRLASLDHVKEIRGKGLMVGLDLTENVVEYMQALRNKGLLVLNAGPNVIRLLPPLTINEDELKQAADLIEETVTYVHS
ncbi:acetylornithine transaminase [Salsuginibacillus kocurii]|uniref:acetylornithine transaminase n=1 Tax=Salsuginibacillus kocurii TaxID=427078 RepID=UPI00037AFD1A|nr:acetylornithine transaminase [Salsuginibacillus kocurii]